MTDEIKPLLEAALFISGRALSIEELAKICSLGNVGAVRKSVEELQADYSAKNSSIEIYESDGRYGMRVNKDYEDRVMHLAPETDMPPAVLKTLALIAYEQPIKQSEVVKQRGNGAYKYIKKLQEAELIEAHKSSRTKILTVTTKFRDYFQINDLKQMIEKDDVKNQILRPEGRSMTYKPARCGIPPRPEGRGILPVCNDLNRTKEMYF